MQGTEGSGSLGGLDVRRRIPIKLLSKQTIKAKPPPRSQRPLGRQGPASQAVQEEGHGYKKEDRVDYGAKAGDIFAGQRRYPQQMFWDYKLHLIGEKDSVPAHICDKCGLPIKVYGRMIPCKHAFCYDCAVHYEKKGDKMCPGMTMYSCTDAVQRIEKCHRGALYMCGILQNCKRTYLSQRDLQAHINHRHVRAAKPSVSRGDSLHHHPPPPDTAVSPAERFRVPPPLLPKPPHVMMPPPGMAVHGGGGGGGGHDPYGQPPPQSQHDPNVGVGVQPPSPDHMGPPRSLPQETFRISTVTTRKHSNLITVPIQEDTTGPGPTTGREGGHPPPQGPPGPGQPPLLHPQDYGAQSVVSHSHHMMAPPPQSHFGPPPPPPPINMAMQHNPQAPPGNPHMGVYNQAPPLSSAPPPMNAPPGHLMGQMPPFMGHPPPGPPPPQHGGPPVSGPPPPHHYNPQDKGTLSPPFAQPGGLSPGMWPPARGPPPPRMQGPPPQSQHQPPHHPDQTRYRPYYQ